MKSDFKKIMRIADEMLSYCHAKGAHEMHFDISEKDDKAVLTIISSPVNITDEDMALLQKKLHAPRAREIEHDYWSLSGKADDSSELVLVGMMTDEATIQYEDHVLTISLSRMH